VVEPVAGIGPPEVFPDVAALTHCMTRGDEAAWRVFYERYQARLFRYLLVMAGNETTARDVLQQTLLRVVRHGRPFAEEAVFWSWLTVLARSSLIDHARGRRRYFSLLERFTRHAHGRPATRCQPDIETADGRLFSLLEQGMAELTADEQDLLGRKYFNAMSVRAIAEALQTSEKAVESRLTRIRRKLKDALMEKLNHETLS
jgi:RNA polymerase sigma-70 factor (ECF subfamily)